MTQRYEAEQGPQGPVPAQSANEGSFLPAHDAQELGARWAAIQANFVDDPRAAVKGADALIGEVFDRVREGFSHQRDELARKWKEGQEPSTEELRIALQRYRGFFQRLLAST